MIYHIEKLTHCYGTKTVLRLEGVSIERGSIVGLIGPNGSGKSTLLRLLAMVESPTRGRLNFNGGTHPRSGNHGRFQVTLLNQEPYLLKRSVFDNVSYGLKVRGETDRLLERVEDALIWVGLDPSHFLRRRWYELSGGEAQRVALAARLVLKPEVLLLDEPTANVDVESGQRIQEATLRARREWGTTLVISSHDWLWLFEVCDTMLHLLNGRLVGSGVENILFGPWARREDGFWVKRLDDGQEMTLPNAPGEQAVAVINPAHVGLKQWSPDLNSNGSDARFCRVSGTLARLSLERATGHVFATVAVSEMMFSARMTSESLRGSFLYPGERVQMEFQMDAVKWLS